MAQSEDFDREKAREDAQVAFGEKATRGAAAMREGVVGGRQGVEKVAEEGVHLVRDVATDTVRAAGEVGLVAIDTARSLLVGVADGLRDVVGHANPWRMRGEAGKEPPEQRP